MDHPLQYLSGGGAFGRVITPLLWWSLMVSIVVILVITAMVVVATVRRHSGWTREDLLSLPLDRVPGVRWIWIGVAISMVPLLITLVWTVEALAAVGPVPRNTAMTIDIVGHQWWWDATYSGSRASDQFRTANEIHIPVGQPVRLRLSSTDVIHSFWVPQLSGKMDVVPGQTNVTWLQADRPGRFEGQCAEFCGFQHAQMRFQVVADNPADFERWREGQLRNAPSPATEQQARGLAMVEYRCAICHAVRGTVAGSHAGPDLTHLMSRATIGAGALPNATGALAGWIEDPQSVKPGALMPPQALSGPQLNDLRAYLETLK